MIVKFPREAIALARTAGRAINAAHMRSQSALECRHAARVSYRARLRRAECWAIVAAVVASAVLMVFLVAQLVSP